MENGFYQHRTVVMGVLGFLTGIWIAAYGISLGSFLFVVLLSGMWWGLKREKLLVLWALVFFGIGILRYQIAMQRFEQSPLMNFLNENVTLEGVIFDYPDIRSDQVKLTLTVEQMQMDLEGKQTGTPIFGQVLISLPRYPDDFTYGMRIRVSGMLEEPPEFEDFSYKNYLRRYGTVAVLYRPFIDVLESASRWNIRFWIGQFKAAAENRLNRLFPEPYASFAAGLLLGSRRGIPADLTEDFMQCGITHIIAISGYNITLMIVFASGLLRFLPKKAQILGSIVFIVAFVALVGASAAVLRAAVMGILGLVAALGGRKAEVTRLLALTAAGMVLWNPFILVDDLGFRLSFSATAGLVYMSGYVENFFKWIRVYDWIPEFFSIREAFLTTMSAQTFSVPVILMSFGRVSLIAPLANVMVAPFIPLAMLFSFVALVVSCVWPWLGLLVAYGAWFFLKFIIWISGILAAVPWASVEVGF
ncbi:MAG: ComEC/Rec2 family competence protein [Candidatus Gracilibacteria bacterium]